MRNKINEELNDSRNSQFAQFCSVLLGLAGGADSKLF